MAKPKRSAAELMDEVNRSTWRRSDSVRWFSRLEGWTDAGERAALQSVAAEAKDQPILDLGVGAGRTVPLLRGISRDYTALDYTPEMVEACRRKYPDARVEHGDARDLAAFAEGAFALVVFSFNGIDAVSPADRLRVLREAHRVLRPGGIFLFSVHNQDGPGHGERFQLGIYFTRNPLKLTARVLRALLTSPRTLLNYRRFSGLNQRSDGYSIMNAAAHNHGILIHYITLEQQLAQLAAAGFAPGAAVFGNRSQRAVQAGEETRGQTWFHFVARKPPAAAASCRRADPWPHGLPRVRTAKLPIAARYRTSPPPPGCQTPPGGPPKTAGRGH